MLIKNRRIGPMEYRLQVHFFKFEIILLKLLLRNKLMLQSLREGLKAGEK